jgi:hypothetical protein
MLAGSTFAVILFLTAQMYHSLSVSMKVGLILKSTTYFLKSGSFKLIQRALLSITLFCRRLLSQQMDCMLMLAKLANVLRTSQIIQ